MTTFEIGTRVTGYCVSMGTAITGEVTEVLYPDGALRWVSTRPQWMVGRDDQDYRCRYAVRGEGTGGRFVVEHAEAAPEPTEDDAECEGSAALGRPRCGGDHSGRTTTCSYCA